jgi:hypothetical protein
MRGRYSPDRGTTARAAPFAPRARGFRAAWRRWRTGLSRMVERRETHGLAPSGRSCSVKVAVGFHAWALFSRSGGTAARAAWDFCVAPIWVPLLAWT